MGAIRVLCWALGVVGATTAGGLALQPKVNRAPVLSAEEIRAAAADFRMYTPPGIPISTPDTLKRPEEPTYLWEYATSQDEMRGTFGAVADLPSLTTLQFGFPYNRGENRMVISLRKGNGSGLMAWLHVLHGQFHCHTDGCSVSMKFDSGPVQNVWCLESSDGDSSFIGVSDAASFLAKVRRSKHLVVEAEFFQEGTHQIEFDTDGLDGTVWK